MRPRTTWITAALATLLLVGAGAGSALAGGAARAAPYCGITWGSLPKTGGALSAPVLVDVRTGRHDCHDRVVFEFDGPADGFDIGYRDVHTEAVGELMNPYVAGGAVLGVQLMAPAHDTETGYAYPARPGGHVAAVVGYPTLRDVVFGGSFEGYATFAVGVRANLPFRVFVLAGPGTHSRIVLDVAHRWQQ